MNLLTIYLSGFIIDTKIMPQKPMDVVFFLFYQCPSVAIIGGINERY